MHAGTLNVVIDRISYIPRVLVKGTVDVCIEGTFTRPFLPCIWLAIDIEVCFSLLTSEIRNCDEITIYTVLK